MTKTKSNKPKTSDQHGGQPTDLVQKKLTVDQIVQTMHEAGVKVTFSLVPCEMVQMPLNDLHAIHELAQRVIKSRQNVGTPLRNAAMVVLDIIQKANKRK